MSNEERKKKKLDIKLEKNQVIVAILIGTIVLSIGALRLLYHDFNIIGQYNEDGWVSRVYVSGSYAYFVSGNDGFTIIDISDPTTPTKVGHFNDGVFVRSIYVSGSYAYVAAFQDGFMIIDISDPTIPTKVGHFDDGDDHVSDVDVVGNYAYVTFGESGLKIFDISDPTTPVKVGQFNSGWNTYEVQVSGSYAYLGELDVITILDISDPTAPTEVGQINKGVGYIPDFDVVGNYAYVTIVGECGIKIFDISDPTTPVEVGYFDDGRAAQDVYVVGNYAYIIDDFSVLKIIDISDPTTPVKVGQINTGRLPNEVFVVEGYAYVNGRNGLEIIDLWSPKERISNLFLWSIISILIFLALGSLRSLIKEFIPTWEDNRGFKDNFANPYWDEGKKKKALDLYTGGFIIIGEGLVIGVILLLLYLLPKSEHFRNPQSVLQILNILLSIIVIIDSILMYRSLRRNRIYLFLGMIIPLLIGLLIRILLLINSFIINVTQGTLLVKYPMVHLIILGSLTLSLGVLFLVVLKIYSKEQGDDPLKGEKNER
ncbi:MAG: LVIVD repeat-containing protein [Promethearchaeota archaeon]